MSTYTYSDEEVEELNIYERANGIYIPNTYIYTYICKTLLYYAYIIHTMYSIYDVYESAALYHRSTILYNLSGTIRLYRQIFSLYKEIENLYVINEYIYISIRVYTQGTAGLHKTSIYLLYYLGINSGCI
jgi:hypothetical protein